MIGAGLCGALCAAGAWWFAGTPLGGLLWCAALVVAVVGYGLAFARLANRRISLALAAVVGLGVVLVVATVLARLGLLRRPVELALVGAGLVGCVAARPELDARTIPRGVAVLAALAGILVVAVAIAGGGARVGDGVNHVLAVKHLWDTGGLAVYHQAGAELVGESFAALATGAQTVLTFDDGLCAALLVALLASELGGQGDLGTVLFVVLALPVVLHPAPNAHEVAIWPAVLLELGMFAALRAAFAERRRGWLALPPALALACLHHEYAVLAAPCIAAALVLAPGQPRRRTVAILAAAWSVGLCAMALAFRISLAGALLRLGAVWLAVPLAVAAVALLGVASPRTALGVLAFALLSFTLAISAGAISPSFVAASALTAMWYGAGLAVASCIEDPLRPDGLRATTVAVVLCLLVVGTILDRNLDDGERAQTIARLADPAAALRDLAALGLPTQAQDEVAALQARVPRGARIDFWGQSAARLDFTRNRIVDVSWAPREWRALYYLRPIAPGRLHRGAYVIVENMRSHPETDTWGTTRAAPTDLVADRLESVAIDGQVRLYRVR